MRSSPISLDELKKTCHRFRTELVEMLYYTQSGHPGGSLSACEMLTVLYLQKMNVDPQCPDWEERDRFILSKGHAAPMLYLAMSECGFFPKEELRYFRQLEHMLQGHPCQSKIPGVDFSSGPLGLGLSAGVGMAAAARVNGKAYNTYVMLGDGELQEGAIWEALMSAAKFKLDNLIILLDCNGVQLDGTTDEVMPLGDIPLKMQSFGMNVLFIDGHDIKAISNAVDGALDHKGSPTVIIANTVKGKGIGFMEGQHIWHSKPISELEYKQAKIELGGARA